MQSNSLTIVLAFYCCVILLFTRCGKKHASLYGEVIINGKVLGLDTNEPIPNAVVEMYNVSFRSGPAGGPIVTTLATSDTTDSQGHFSLHHTATGQYEFSLAASHNNRRYINPRSETITRVGTQNLNLECYRSAIAKISLTNVAPIDTASKITLDAAERIDLHNFYKDSIFHLKLSTNVSPTTITYRVYKDNGLTQSTQYIQVAVNPWDTINLQQNY